MKINSISNNAFDGKIKFDADINKAKRDFVEKVLDVNLNGSTLRKRIAKANYDVRVSSADTKRTIHPKVNFSCKFKKLKEFPWETCTSFDKMSQRLKIKETPGFGAFFLNQFLDQFERIKNNTNYSYNSFGELVCAAFNKMFGIKK